MYRRLFTAAALLLVGLFPLLLGIRPAAADSWVATGTQGMTLTNATDLGALPGATPITVRVALKLNNQAALNQYIKEINDPGSSLYESALTPSQFAAQYGPTSSQVQAVTSYLSSQGFSNIQVEANNLLVSADGTAAQADAAFNTHLEQFQQNGRTLYVNTSTADVPSSLSGNVLAVLGLNNAGRMTTPNVSVPVYPNSFVPQSLWKAYDVGTTPSGGKTNIAIFAEGNLSGVVQDLHTAEKAFGLPSVPYSIVQVGLASPDTSGADEWDMDTQYSTGMAQTVSHLYLYDTTSLTDSDIALEFNRFAAQDVAKAGSASFGECETFPYLDGSMLADDEVFAEAAAQGQTVFASSGDTGGSCAVAPTNGVPLSGPPNVNYPASSPYVTAVGGTTLLVNSDGSYNNEVAWNAGGGGASLWEYSPYWESGIVPTNAGNLRGVPDIAMDADPYSGVTIYMNGAATCCYGGTSLSSPLALGSWARLESAHGNKIGNASPNLYHLYASYPFPQTAQVPTSASGFHDIIAGDNGPYPATPGWDYATGLGSFDLSAMNAVIR